MKVISMTEQATNNHLNKILEDRSNNFSKLYNDLNNERENNSHLSEAWNNWLREQDEFIDSWNKQDTTIKIMYPEGN